MSTYATPESVQDLWLGTEELPSKDKIQKWLDKAELLIFTEIPTIADRLTDDPDQTWARRVAFVEEQLVMQVMRNPDGVRQLSQTAGTFTDSKTFGSETITQLMELTPVHRAMLSGSSGRHSGIDMTEDQSRLQHPLAGAWVNGPYGTAPGEHY